RPLGIGPPGLRPSGLASHARRRHSGSARRVARPHFLVRLSHLNITMPRGEEDAARAFYSGLLGLTEIPKPEPLRARGGVWFDAGGMDIPVPIEEDRLAPDFRRHFGLEAADVDAVRVRLAAAGVKIDPGRPAPWKRFFAWDPFGNRLEIHEPAALRE